MPLKHRPFDLALLRERLTYDPDTGLFYRRVDNPPFKAGERAGYLRWDGYWDVRIGGVLRKAHRLAWFYMTGEYPALEIDHINGDRGDNRWCNLRLATSAQNKHNMRVHRDNVTGFKGVTWDKERQRFAAQIFHDGHQHHLGRFSTAVEAARVYRRAEQRLRPVFAPVR